MITPIISDITPQTTIKDLLAQFEGLRPSIRTFNLMSREGIEYLGDLMELEPEEILEWRNSIDQTVSDIAVLQDAVGKMLRVFHKVPLRNTTELLPSYAVRLIQWETWWKAHDSVCPRWWDCRLHRNPHEER